MKKIPIILAIISAFCFKTEIAKGQCTPAIPDACSSLVSITGLPSSASSCAGGVHTFTPTINVPAPLTFTGYTWSPAVTSHSSMPVSGGLSVPTTIISSSSPSTYCLTATALGPNVIANGDFEAGNACFTTGYILDADITPTPPYTFHYILVNTYNVRADFLPYFPGGAGCSFGDATTGTGNMMIVNGSNSWPIRTVWQQSVNVCAGATYQFSMAYANWSNPTAAPLLEVEINGTVIGNVSSTAACGIWQQVQFAWVNGSATNVSVVIRDLNMGFASNDFTLDDISLRRVSTAQACVNITPLPAPVFTLTPSSTDVCSGQPFTITSSFAGGGCPGCTMVWGAGAAGLVGDPITLTEFTTGGISNLYTYTVTNSLGCSSSQSTIVTIHPQPDAGHLSISLAPGSTICSGSTIYVNRMGGMAGGTWSTNALPGVATVTPTGVVHFGTVLVPTTITVFYTVTSPFCDPDVASINIIVNPRPILAVTVPATVCSGNTVLVCAPVVPASTGGAWTTYAWSWGPTTSPCAISPVVYTAGGVSVIHSVTVTNSYGCATTEPVSYTVVPNPLPQIVPGTRPDLCVGQATVIGGLPGYTYGSFVESWSSSNSAIASVSSGGPGIGTIVGVSPGTANITYTVTDPATGCFGIDIFTITIYATPAPIGGLSIICVGSSVILTNPTAGGVWASSDPAVAAIVTDPSGNGIVTGVAPGTATIYYTLNHRNIKCPASMVVTVFATPRPQIRVNPSPTPDLCVYETTLIHGTAGYAGTYTETWTSSAPAVATVASLSTGIAIITAVSPGTATITYTVTDPITGCSGFATFLITVYAVPLPISVPPLICEGSSVPLTSATPGGFWSSSDPSVADVVPDAFGNGIVTGISGGTAQISYTLMHGGVRCPAILVVTVVPEPTAICPTWYNDPVLGPVFIIGGAPAGAVVTYDCYDPWGGLLAGGSGTATVGSTVSTYPVGANTLCITSVTYLGCTWPVSCCVTFNGGGPRPAPDNTVSENRVGNISNFSVVPNPNKGLLTLTADLGGNDEVSTAVIHITDVLGKVVLSEEVEVFYGRLSKQISLSEEIANGVYLIKVTYENEFQLVRCVLNR